LGICIGNDYISVASKWLQKEKCYVTNIISTAALRSIWLTRNDFIFNNQGWRNVKLVLRRMLRLSEEWQLLCKGDKLEEMILVTILGEGDRRATDNCSQVKLTKAQATDGAGQTILILSNGR
jgi:hypothetical protein